MYVCVCVCVCVSVYVCLCVGVWECVYVCVHTYRMNHAMYNHTIFQIFINLEYKRIHFSEIHNLIDCNQRN